MEGSKKVTIEEMRELLKYHPAFQPFREKLNEMRVRVAKRRITGGQKPMS